MPPLKLSRLLCGARVEFGIAIVASVVTKDMFYFGTMTIDREVELNRDILGRRGLGSSFLFGVSGPL